MHSLKPTSIKICFLSNNLGECLNDEPTTDQYKYKNMLAGAIYDAEYQCRNRFPNSTVCPVPEEVFCDKMMCKVSETSCMSNTEPLADGTKCGENKVSFYCFVLSSTITVVL